MPERLHTAGPRRGLIVAVAVALAGPSAMPAADWEMSAARDGTPAISCRKAPVVGAQYCFWGAQWKYAGAQVRVGPPGGEGAPLSGTIAGLGISVGGKVASPKPNQLRFAWQLNVQADLTGIVGGGMEFRPVLDSPALGGEAKDPELLPDNRGWRWPVGEGKELRVEFDPPAANVYFERGNKGQIRCMFLGADVPAGTRTVVMTVTLPEGGQVVRSAGDRYGPGESDTWWPGVMAHDASPVDLSFLNDKPAGKHGFVKAAGDELAFADGTPVRFWGGNIAAYAIFADKRDIKTQAKRIAQLGYNLMRIHHHDSTRWVGRTVIDKTRDDTQQLDPEVMDRLDWWIQCLRDEGVYVWLDLHVGREFKDGDAIGEGFAEIKRRGGEGKGYCYFNDRVEQLMREFNAKYLAHVNPYTKLAYKDDPAVMGLLLTNENDLTGHFGNLMLPDKNNPWHNGVFNEAVKAFAAGHNLPAGPTGQTWLPGPSKLFLADREHAWNARMMGHLTALGVKVPVATTQMWGNMDLFGLPALTAGGIIDVHSYGRSEALSANPRYRDNYVGYFVTGQAWGKPVAITEWNVPYPNVDRFTAPLYVASVCALQGIDAPMIYNYSQRTFDKPSRGDTWSSYFDPGLQAIMPAAAVAYRRDVKPAKDTYCLRFDRQALYHTAAHPRSLAALRTLLEQSKVTIGLPDTPELDWDAESKPPAGVKAVAELDRDFIPAGQDFVRSDTGQLTRNWVKGYQTLDAGATQAAHGWIGGEKLALTDVTFEIATPKAAVAVTALDGKPVRQSRKLLITAVARVVASKGGRTPLLSEPVVGTLTIRAPAGLTLVALKGDGTEAPAAAPAYAGGAYAVKLDKDTGTHWLMLK
ncbi:MAG TPA: glycosyl hydrolase family 5 [Phycisphaerae bacterium]|nr:glycosyl hydrolase family 5 [Phycisphaerae bacterium]